MNQSLWRKVVDIDLTGLFNFSRARAHHMPKGRGSLIGAQMAQSNSAAVIRSS